jgi:hypothetical protein
MESKINTSFIPNQMPNRGKTADIAKYSGDAFDIVLLISIVAFVAAVVLSAGVFLYGEFLNKKSENKSAQLEKARGAFDPELIQELLALDKRISAAGVVLDNHLAPSQLLVLLGDVTLKSVGYKKLEYSTDGDGKINLMLEGKAKSVNAVALQASLFSEHNAIKNPIFSNLNLVKDGVTFDVEAEINPAAINYGFVYDAVIQKSLQVGAVTDVTQEVNEVTEEELGAFAPNQDLNTIDNGEGN